eukprot:m.327528 g.327528  ORF g.327528 m.327528 type:complete len:259 (+) comp16492_c0_seq8:2470-3246(+)
MHRASRPARLRWRLALLVSMLSEAVFVSPSSLGIRLSPAPKNVKQSSTQEHIDESERAGRRAIANNCTYTAGGKLVDLSGWRGITLVGKAEPPGVPLSLREAHPRHSLKDHLSKGVWAAGGRSATAEHRLDLAGPSFNLSLCGNLSTPCIDELTRVRQPPGALYSQFGGEPAGRCWDVLARWEHLVSVTLPPNGPGVTLAFSRPGDPHIDCTDVSVEVAVECDRAGSTDPREATLVGRQTACDWKLRVRTADPAVCRL